MGGGMLIGTAIGVLFIIVLVLLTLRLVRR
jgi:hypothetical protein